ncbi:hypothetical protein [Demequina maris]|uniref:hypothetical protein n=1 Tax=Demequina maris TaxID=1638982 RepID=UPI000785E2A8|nr:hypothetical protein [Demequina maris]
MSGTVATLCRADLRALRAARFEAPADERLVVLRPLALAAALDRQDALAAGDRRPSVLAATLRAWARARRLVRAAGPGARIVRPGSGELGAALGAPVAEPHALAPAERDLLESIDRGLAGTPTPRDVRLAVVRGAVLHALYAAAETRDGREGEMLDAATAQAAVAGAVSALLGHGLAFEDPDGTPLLRERRREARAVPTLDSLSTVALLRLLLPLGRKT